MSFRPGLLFAIFVVTGCQTLDSRGEVLRAVIENGGAGDFCCIKLEGQSSKQILRCRIEAKDESVSNPEISKFYSAASGSIIRPVIQFRFPDDSERTFVWVDSFELADPALIDPWGYVPKFVEGKWPEIDWESGLVIRKHNHDVIKAMDCDAEIQRNMR